MERLLEILNITDWASAGIQLIGYAALILALVAYQMKTQKRIVLIQLLSCTLFTIHFALLDDAFTGALLNLIAAVRCIVFANKDKKWGKSNWWIVFFSIVSVSAVAFTWTGVLDILPMLGMILTSIAWGIEKAWLVRLISLPSSPLWIIYNLSKGAMAGAFTEVFVMISIISAMIRLDLPKKKKG